MPAGKPGPLFWARAVALQLLLLGLWWTVLYRPSLTLLRVTAQVPFALLTGRQDRSPLEVDPSGEWKFSIPVNTVVRDSPQAKDPVAVDAIEFAASPENVAPFATGWFVYLALALNGSLTAAALRRTLIGLLLQTAVAALGLFAYAEINAWGIANNMHRTPDALLQWIQKLAYHLDYLVVPYASPFLVLLATHPQWWAVLTGAEVPPETSKPPKKRSRRR